MVYRHPTTGETTHIRPGGRAPRATAAPRAAAAAASNSSGRGDGVDSSSSASPAASASVSVRERDDSSVVATRTVSVRMVKSATEGFGLEIGDDAAVIAYTDTPTTTTGHGQDKAASLLHMAEALGIEIGWLIVSVELEGVEWPTHESREKIVELLSTVDAGEEVGFTFETQGKADQKLH